MKPLPLVFLLSPLDLVVAMKVCILGLIAGKWSWHSGTVTAYVPGNILLVCKKHCLPQFIYYHFVYS